MKNFLNIEKNEKWIQYGKQRLRKLFRQAYEKEPDLCCKLFLYCVINKFVFIENEADKLLDYGLVTFVGLVDPKGNTSNASLEIGRPIFQIEPLMHEVLTEEFSLSRLSQDFATKCLNQAFQLLLNDQLQTNLYGHGGKGETFEVLEALILCLLAQDKTKTLRDYPIFKAIPEDIPLHEYNCEIAAFKNGDLSNWKFDDDKFVLKPSDDNFGGPDKVFILTPNPNANLKPILVLIQDKNTEKTRNWKDAVKSVLVSKLCLRQEDKKTEAKQCRSQAEARKTLISSTI